MKQMSSLPELIDDREGVFKRPKTKKEILRDRQIIYVDNFRDIKVAHEYRKANQVVIIAPNVELIPGQSRGKIDYNSAQNYSKRGGLIQIPTFDETESIKREWSDLRARINACEKNKDKVNGLYVGMSWVDPEKVVHIVHPTTVFEGHRLNMYATKSRTIKDRVEVRDEEEVDENIRKVYGASDSHLKTLRVLVPSRSRNQKHTVLVEHVTDAVDPKRYAEWMRIKTRHECELKREDFSFRFPNYVTYCPHDVAAFVQISKTAAEVQRKVIPQPFPLFSEPMLRLYLSLSYDTLKADVYVDGNDIRQRVRPLTFTEMDPVLMNAWLEYGNKSTFYAHAPTQHYKRMTEFNWANSAAGMPFIDKRK